MPLALSVEMHWMRDMGIDYYTNLLIISYSAFTIPHSEFRILNLFSVGSIFFIFCHYYYWHSVSFLVECSFLVWYCACPSSILPIEINAILLRRLNSAAFHEKWIRGINNVVDQLECKIRIYYEQWAFKCHWHTNKKKFHQKQTIKLDFA